MYIGGNRVWQKALLNRGDRISKEEAAGAMADVEQHAPLASRQHVWSDLPVLVEDEIVAAVEVRVSVAGTHVFQNQISHLPKGFDKVLAQLGEHGERSPALNQ